MVDEGVNGVASVSIGRREKGVEFVDLVGGGRDGWDGLIMKSEEMKRRVEKEEGSELRRERDRVEEEGGKDGRTSKKSLDALARGEVL